MGDEEEVPAGPKAPKALIVLTSVDKFPDESPTGYYLSEATHPYFEFLKNGWEVDFASVAGTTAADPSSVEAAAADKETMAFWNDEEKKKLLDAPTTLEALATGETPATELYQAIYFSGGFGAMWDFPTSEHAQALVKAFYEAGKVVAAVCHGPIVFANVALGDETKLVADKEMTGFSNAEEVKMEKMEVVSAPSGPGSCQDALTASGAKFQVGLPFESQVVKVAGGEGAGILMTGQNPASAGPLATAIVYHFDPIKAEFEPPRLAMLTKRAVLVADIEEAEFNFVAKLDQVKTDAAKTEELQTLSQAGRDFRAAALADLDMQLERNATRRQAALDAKAKAEAATEEE